MCPLHCIPNCPDSNIKRNVAQVEDDIREVTLKLTTWSDEIQTVATNGNPFLNDSFVSKPLLRMVYPISVLTHVYKSDHSWRCYRSGVLGEQDINQHLGMHLRVRSCRWSLQETMYSTVLHLNLWGIWRQGYHWICHTYPRHLLENPRIYDRQWIHHRFPTAPWNTGMVAQSFLIQHEHHGFHAWSGSLDLAPVRLYFSTRVHRS